ncbi:MAG TPA: hypothetical protein VJR89_25945, partial [Polyangiales bacterium]|nr:hypothetical protein [Polyangiales bacterium]
MAYSDPLTPALLDTLRAQLAAGERLAWAASPEPAAFEGRREKTWDAAVILGGGYATIGACVMALRTEHWWWLSVPLALFAAYGVVRWIKARTRRRRAGTAYAVTTRRALIVHTYPALAVHAVPIQTLADVTLRDPRKAFADLGLRTAAGADALVFRGILEPERARNQLLRVIRDPQAAEQEIA